MRGGALSMKTNVDLAVEAVALGVGFSNVHVEIVTFRRYGGPGRAGRWKPREYLVIVMRSDAEIAAVPLGAAAASTPRSKNC